MRSAIGNSLLLSVVIIIASAVMLLFVSILSYSKAYRVKNRIIEIIERHGYFEDDTVKNEISSYLKDVGYQLGECEEADKPEVEQYFSKQDTKGYKYCVEGVYENQKERISKTIR